MEQSSPDSSLKSQDFLDSFLEAVIVFEIAHTSNASDYICQHVNRAFTQKYQLLHQEIENTSLSSDAVPNTLLNFWRSLRELIQNDLSVLDDHLLTQKHRLGKQNVQFRSLKNGFWILIEDENTVNKPLNTAEEEKKNAEINAQKLLVTGKIARNIAHEVRNPLTNLNMAVEQLKDELDEEMSEGTEDTVEIFIDIIKRNSDRIEQLIAELLNTTRVNKLNLKPQSVNEILRNTLLKAKDRIELREIELIEDYQVPNSLMLSLDTNSIEIAFLNLIVNAIEAISHDQGKIEISTQSMDSSLMVVVKDNGDGIPPEYLKKLFEPFFTSKTEGVGLGLTSTRNIFHQHKARVEVESSLGEGTTFKILFPLT